MWRTFFGIFVVLHGLVHLWLVVLSQELIEYKPEMGWTARSWLFTGLIGDSATRWLATIVFVLVTAAFVVSGVGVFTRGDWWRSIMVGAAVISAAMLLFFWDGSAQLIVEKGLIGFLIDVAVVVSVLVLGWPGTR
jgi:hypothetical protein